MSENRQVKNEMERRSKKRSEAQNPLTQKQFEKERRKNNSWKNKFL